MVNILSESSSIVNQFISEIRDAEIQKDSLRFRFNLDRLGGIFAYEISKTLAYLEKEVTTPLGIAQVPVLKEYPVIISILRAGLPFHQGFLRLFDKSENGFIAAYRKTHKDHTFTIQVENTALPALDSKTLIICDAMIATGSSMTTTYRELLNHGKPGHIHIASILASQEGLDRVRRQLPAENITFWLGVIDDELTAQAFIVPGLGDAGDLAYGQKV